MTGGGRFGDCEFEGTVESESSNVCESLEYTSLEYQDEGLSWDHLVDACPELKYAGCYTSDQQIEQNQLIWPNEDNACDDCPRCPCSNETDSVRRYVRDVYNVGSLSNLINQYCYQCTCS